MSATERPFAPPTLAAWATDRELRVVWHAGAAFSSNPSVVGKTVPELFAQSPDRERVLEGYRRALAGEPYRLDIDDGTGAAHLQVEPFRDPGGNVIGVVGIAFDITDRVRIEEEVRAGQQLLRQVLDTLPLGVILLDRAGDVLLGDSASGGTIVSGVERRAIRPDEWASLRALEDGQTIRHELTGAVVGNEDATEHVRAGEVLRQTERLLVEAEKLGQTGSWEQDLISGQVINTEANRRLFFGDDRSKGTRLEDYAQAIHPDDRESVWRRRGELLAGTGSGDIDYRVVWPDGTVRWIFGRATVVRDQSGRLIRTYGTNADITDRKLAEAELARRAHEQSALAQEQSALAQLSLTALKGDETQALLHEATAALQRTLGVEYGLVLEWRPEKERMEFRAGAGPSVDEALRDVYPSALPGFMAWFNLRSEAPVVVEDLPAETRFVPCELLMALGVKSGITVPIAGKERPFGVLSAATKAKRRFSDHQLQFVWSMANVLATSIEHARAAAELEEKREQLRALSRKLIEAQEAERRAVARELHDDFGQVLTALRLNLGRHDRDDAESIALVDGAIERMRELATDLRPPLLDEFGLEASLRWYVEREAKRAGLVARLGFTPLSIRPPGAVETTCFRVAQEALTNVIRHAQAHSVEVELGPADGRLQLVVRDDGRGFDVAAARKRATHGGSQGLLSMQERVALAGGELGIDSAAGRGTTIVARLPATAAREP